MRKADLVSRLVEAVPAEMTMSRFAALTVKSEATITAKVIADSVAPNGCRLTTMEWTYPRCIHSEIMTHRQFSKNSASSRAIPLAKMIKRVTENPFFWLHWGKNEKGMQATEELSAEQKLLAAENWILERDVALILAQNMEDIGIHKQIGNRMLEPWMWITIVISGTNWENLFALRCHKDAEPHFQNLAYKARDAYDASVPAQIPWGGWHLPYLGLSEEDNAIPEATKPRISAARCGRVSYLTQAGIRDPEEDRVLYGRLADNRPMHASPLEHPAQAIDPTGQPDFSIGGKLLIDGKPCTVIDREAFFVVAKFATGEESSYDIDELRAYKRVSTPVTTTDWGNFDPGWLQFRKVHVGECVRVRG